MSIDNIKDQILAALRHVEAEEGLYLRNFSNLHEVDERTRVEADDEQLIIALGQLIEAGMVITENGSEEPVYRLAVH